MNATKVNRDLRWGIVGTGMIANQMAPLIRQADAAEPVAVCSRKLGTARAFADRHRIGRCFDSWAELVAWDGVDAIYVATPTSTREAICVAAATHGKHVLGEKPYASLASLRRITASCREHGVGFMDGTHFVHHPRTARIQAELPRRVGWVGSLDSAFHAGLTDPDDIRLDPELEPMGAIGDLGWYNMRAAVEFLPPRLEVVRAAAHLRRDRRSGAAIGGGGIVVFDDGASATWNCSADSGALNMDLRIGGAGGIVAVDDFVGNRVESPLIYRCRRGGFGTDGVSENLEVDAAKPAAALMFEAFAAMVGDPARRQHSIRHSERTQALLDTIWHAALAAEND